jgi:uncharacterized membrane protein YkvA (DUF1232 family)
MIERLRVWAGRLKLEIAVLAAAIKDSRTPWYAKLLGIVIVAYALSPLDLIPDVIPVLGILDDLVLLPAGIWLVRRLIPQHVLAEHRAAVDAGTRLPPSWSAAAIIAALWLFAIFVVGRWLWDWLAD